MCVSIFIQTLNEEQNLPGLLDSVAWADDVVVLDSLSTDRTRDIALAHGCRWFERAYDGRGPHQNWAMENIRFRHKWVFYLDADERMTPELREEITSIADDPAEKRVAFFCGRKNYFMGRWIRHAMPPSNIMRFFQPRHIRFERLANPTPAISGPHGYLRNYFLHYNFSKGLAEWLERHNRYSTYEAIETIKALEDQPVRLAGLFARDPIRRRRELKNISFRLPGRPALKFLYMYLAQRGFLDGSPGFHYCVLQAFYEYQIALKVKTMLEGEEAEISAAVPGLAPPIAASEAV